MSLPSHRYTDYAQKHGISLPKLQKRRFIYYPGESVSISSVLSVCRCLSVMCCSQLLKMISILSLGMDSPGSTVIMAPGYHGNIVVSAHYI